MANLDTLPNNDGRMSFSIWNWLQKAWRKVNDHESRITTLESTAMTTAIQSIQTVSAAAGSLSSGSGVESKYKDVSISAVVINKSVVEIQGQSDTGEVLTAYLTSTTNVRVCCQNSGATTLNYRFYVIEFK